MILEALWLVGLLTWAGLALFDAVVMSGLQMPSPRTTAWARQAIDRLRQPSAVVAMVSGWLLVLTSSVITTPGDSQVSWSLDGDRLVSAVVATITVVVGEWVLRTGPFLVAATIAGVSALSLSGHSRSGEPLWLIVAANIIHSVTAAVWLGGIIALWCLLRPHDDAHAGVAAHAVARFSWIAAWLLVALGCSALVMLWRVAPGVATLWSTSYGRLVVAKCLIVVAALGLAAFNRYRVVPTMSQHRGRKAGLARLRRTVLAEMLLIATAAAVTAVLVNLNPGA